jgi:hypothetical protein
MWGEYSLSTVLADGFISEVKLNTAITAHMAIPNAPSLFYDSTLAPTINKVFTFDRQALFSSKIFREKIVDFPSHQIFRHMHEALNIHKK